MKREPFVNCTFLDPPFNQKKDYREHNDNMNEADYWQLMADVCLEIYELTLDGGVLYFMHREKALENTMRITREAGFTFQNVIIWVKTASTLANGQYGKAYQPILFFSKGKKPLVHNALRVHTPSQPHYKLKHPEYSLVNDVWTNIRELTAGFLAGPEALRNEKGERIHLQQAPIHLLLRMMLQSTKVGDAILDPFAGTGTTAIVARQLQRRYLCIENDAVNVEVIKKRLAEPRNADEIGQYRGLYDFQNSSEVWPSMLTVSEQNQKVTAQ